LPIFYFREIGILAVPATAGNTVPAGSITGIAALDNRLPRQSSNWYINET
jgi:hypothetical protein